MAIHRLSLEQARRIAVHAQLLDLPRPTDLVATVERLTILQIDPTAAIAPNADLVLWSRLGASYDPADLTSAIERDHTLVETVAYVRHPADVAAVVAEVREGEPYPDLARWLTANDSFRRDILDRLEADGPLLSRDIADTSVVPWPSSGWTNNRNITKMLEALALRGEVAIAGRKGRQRYFDLPGRVYPHLPYLTLDQALEHRNRRRLAALGIARSSGTVTPGEHPFVGEAGEPAEVDGVPGTWRVHAAYLDGREDDAGAGRGRTALLSPFDRLIHDRVRAQQLWGFEYILEMYKPAAQRRWGYFALPILHHDRLVGKLDARGDRKAGTLVVNAVHEDVRFTKAIQAGVDREIADLAAWLGLRLTGPAAP
ncbi:MAG: hypothetical protein JWP82_2818 [Humibacillus sp.]|nr:hypothetical protein [Humibacillus sp.]